MNKESVTNRLRPGIRLGLSSAIIVGLSVLGAGALAAGPAGAAATGGGGSGPIKQPVTCSSAVSLGTTYGYTYVIATGEVVSLSGSGCSTSANPVTVTFEDEVVSPGRYPNVMEQVTPSCPITAPHDRTFSYSLSVSNTRLYLTAAEADKVVPGNEFEDQSELVASQPATGASYSLSFILWYA